MTHDYETCRYMMWKYARWWKRAFEAGDCFAKFYSDEWKLWNDRAEAAYAEGGAA